MIKRICSIRRDGCLDSERGNAFVEFLISFAFLATVIIAVVDIGRALLTYMTVSRIAYEGARYMATLPGMTQTTCVTSPSLPACVDPVHQAVRTRLNPIFDRTIVSAGATTITTDLFGPLRPLALGGTFSGTADERIAAEQRIVRIRVQAQFVPIFLPFSFMTTLTSESSGPYLFPL